MKKKCIICGSEAIYKIKDTPDYYCPECAEENFSDLNVLVTVEEEAQRLKKSLKEKMDDLLQSEEDLDKLTGPVIASNEKENEGTENRAVNKNKKSSKNVSSNQDWED